jgi:hypothetical protein
VVYHCRRTMSMYGCLYLNPSAEPVQCAKISGLSRPVRIVACACWSKRDQPSIVRFCGQDCSDSTTSIPCQRKKSVTKRTNVQCLLSCLFITSIKITDIEDKQKIPRQNIFPLVESGMFLKNGISGPKLTLLSRL